ncbi:MULTISPECIES: winged helix-turn-helix transcriptional regulator [Sphingomonas]|uniref:winged helix-turn-helix transcriptional regulator n=1 Tax=Sphingomonas TaxID=13687 RepID=UPI00082DE3A5|nr:helix-turn-helix domain-containing protein [Sphingomonas sp. CCH10-B3]
MKLEKVIDGSGRAAKRWYDDACGTAHAMELVGERWSLLIIRELMFGPRRFADLRRTLPGISANVLTQRLAGLEAAGILQRRRLPPPAAAQVYELTPWGYECDVAIMALGRWAARSPEHDPTLPLSAASLMLSFRTMVSADRLGSGRAEIGLQLGGDGFVARLGGGTITIARETPADVGALLTGTPEAIAAVVYGGRPLGDAMQAGDVRVEGSRARAEWFVTLFPLPAKVGMPG